MHLEIANFVQHKAHDELVEQNYEDNSQVNYENGHSITASV